MDPLLVLPSPRSAFRLSPLRIGAWTATFVEPRQETTTTEVAAQFNFLAKLNTVITPSLSAYLESS